MSIVISALMFTGCAGISNNNQTNTYRSITMDEAVTMMSRETGYIILDVRRPDEFSAGHIPNAINVPNETIGTAEIPELPDKDQFIMAFTALTGGISHFMIGGIPNILCLVLCVVFTLIWARIAAKIANKANAKTLNRVVGFVMIVTSVVILAVKYFN